MLGQGAGCSDLSGQNPFGAQEVALKLFNREIPQERINSRRRNNGIGEKQLCSRVRKGIGHWKKDRYFIALEYIDGESMSRMD